MGNAYTGFMRALLLMVVVGLGAVLFAAPRQDGMGEPPAAAQEATEANLLDGLKILGEIIRKGPAAEPVKGATAFEKGESPIAIATLVKELTAEADAQKQFVELYGQLEEAFAAQAKEMKVENDLASAVAFFFGLAVPDGDGEGDGRRGDECGRTDGAGGPGNSGDEGVAGCIEAGSL